MIFIPRIGCHRLSRGSFNRVKMMVHKGLNSVDFFHVKLIIYSRLQNSQISINSFCTFLYTLMYTFLYKLKKMLILHPNKNKLI